MFLDARHVAADSVVETGVCIVGAGPVGLSMALELAERSVDVCVLESGGFRVEAQTQALAAGDCLGLPFLPPEISRVRAFGGTSRRWGGICRPLEADAFAPRPWIAHSGWPITARELEPFYAKALERLGIGPVGWLPGQWDHGLAALMGAPQASRLQPANFAVSPTLRLGREWRGQLDAAGTIQVHLHANAREIETNDTGTQAERIRVACLDGKTFQVRARVFVLATGGIENARLLLLANKVHADGIGNRHGLVGRFLMNHPQLGAAWIVPTQDGAPLRTAWPRLARSLQRATLAPATAAAEEIANFSAFLVPVGAPGEHPLHAGEGFRSLSALLGVNPRSPQQRDVAALLRAVAGDLGGLAADLRRKLTTLTRGAPVICVLAENEQVPDPESRVTLSTKRDRLGMNQVEVRWRLGELDRRTMCRGIAIVGEELRRSGRGTLIAHEWVRDGCAGSFPGEDWAHHAGTTRMSDDPRSGVVDRHCRVHGVDNLYVAGASVFPTEGIPPPTLTAMALAIRLAGHIRSVLPQSRVHRLERRSGSDSRHRASDAPLDRAAFAAKPLPGKAAGRTRPRAT